MATHPQLAATLEGMAPFCPGGCGVVSVSGGRAPAALSAAALRVLEAPLNVLAVAGPGRLRVLPEVLLPEAGQCGHGPGRAAAAVSPPRSVIYSLTSVHSSASSEAAAGG